MMTVLLYALNTSLYLQEFDRRFRGKFPYQKSNQGISWNDMRIIIVHSEPRGYRADIAIGFNQQGIDMFTRGSRINIKKKRTTTYFDLLDAINDDGSFSWERYLKKVEEDDWLSEL